MRTKKIVSLASANETELPSLGNLSAILVQIYRGVNEYTFI